MSPEVGDVVCKILIVSGGLVLLALSARWLLSLIRGQPKREIPLRWRREDDRTPGDAD